MDRGAHPRAWQLARVTVPAMLVGVGLVAFILRQLAQVGAIDLRADRFGMGLVRLLASFAALVTG